MQAHCYWWPPRNGKSSEFILAPSDIYNRLLVWYSLNLYTNSPRSAVTSSGHSIFLMTLAPYPLMPIVGILASVVNILTIATSFHQTWNIGLYLISTWLFIDNFLRGIEGIAWHGASGIKAPVWCDICTFINTYTSHVLFSTKRYQQQAVSALRLQLPSQLARW